LIDASGVVLGRLASFVANILRGKNKAIYTPHSDCGDYVVIINAAKVHLTGKKRQDKEYYWHTGFPGGIKRRTAEQILDGRFPERVVQKAVERMVPRGPLGDKILKKLKVYAGPTTPHEAQMSNIQTIDMGKLNAKNTSPRARKTVNEAVALA
jgi:large subunit ribosomal protein L13